mmetsp:Transcript_25044/g.43951  ORF Transcript_25044/g.43951 Transcript_25044/m.43951 type:complete len:260 (+) Transcript_25044:283-1062(+)
MRLEGLKVLVTGGSSGLGLATAALFARSACDVAVWDINAEVGMKNAATIGARFYETDVGNIDSVKASWAQTVRDLGRTDVVVNCAGIGHGAPVIGVPVDHTLKLFDRVIKVNTYGTYLISVLAGQQMATQTEVNGERGVIINVSSIFAKYGDFFISAYAASKGSIEGMTLPLARDFATHKIRINTIAPGFFETAMTQPIPHAIGEFAKSQTTTLSKGQPEQFAQFVQTIVENKYISGSIMPLDAGLVIANSKTLGKQPS